MKESAYKQTKNVLVATLNRIKPLNILMLILAGAVNATGVILLLSPASVIDGGFSGTSVLLSMLTPLSVSVYLLILNVPFFVFGYRKLGFQFIVYSLVSIGSYALVSFLYQDVFALDEKVFELMGKDVFLATVFGGVVSGIGSGLTIRFGGAIDGVEVLAIVFAKKIGVTVGQFVMAYNCVVYVFAMVALHNMAIGLYSIVSYFVGLKVVDFLVDGFDKGKAFTVITEHGNKVARAITETVKQGVTVTESKGFFSGTRRDTLYCVVNRFEAVRLKNVIKSVDPGAFIAICEISEVVGNKTRYTSAKERRLHETTMKLKNLEQDIRANAEMMEMINRAIAQEKPHDEASTNTDKVE